MWHDMMKYKMGYDIVFYDKLRYKIAVLYKITSYHISYYIMK